MPASAAAVEATPIIPPAVESWTVTEANAVAATKRGSTEAVTVAAKSSMSTVETNRETTATIMMAVAVAVVTVPVASVFMPGARFISIHKHHSASCQQ